MAVRRSRKSSGSDPYSVALRLLTLRDRSTTELAGKLRERGFGTADVEAAVGRCVALGYLNDERFAASRARALVDSGRAVGIRALNELRKAGIDRGLAEMALAEAESAADLPALLDAVRRRKYPDFDFDRATDREKNRVVSYLQRRGFPVSMILDVLKNSKKQEP